MSFRVATLNLEQDHKRWELRRKLIIDELGRLRPDLWALNEISIPAQTGRWLQRTVRERLGIKYALLQQPKAGGSAQVEAEGILSRFPPIEVTSLDYQADNAVAQVARFEIESRLVDLYVTHLYKSRGTDPLRHFQVELLLEWIHRRNDVDAQVVCGDFNATLEMPSIKLMTQEFQPTQTQPTAFTPLAEKDGTPSHPYWERMDRCIDYIWVTKCLTVRASGRCFDNASSNDPTLWPSDHVGVWADLDFVDNEVTNSNAARRHTDESDRALRLGRIIAKAAVTLGNEEKAVQWLRTPNRALGNRTPLELLDNDIGSRQVEEILGRIEHGNMS